MNHLTHREIMNAKPEDRDYYLNDGSGLRVRVKPVGIKLFEHRYYSGGKRHTAMLGTFPETRLKEARARSFEIRRMVDAGKDPKLEKRKEDDKRRAEELEKLVQGLFEDFRDNYLRPNRKRPEQAEEYLEKDVLHFIGKLRAKDVDRRHIVEIVESGALRKADMVLSLVKQMLSHGAAKGFVNHHSCPDLQKKHFRIKSQSRRQGSSALLFRVRCSHDRHGSRPRS